MKLKILGLIAILTISLVGCSKENKDMTNQESTTGNNTQSITEEKAKEIALSKVKNGKIVGFYFDENDTNPNYDIEISDGEYEYEFEINANNGEIIEKEKKMEQKINNIDTSNLISQEKAEEMALSKVPNGKIIEISLDADNNIPNYDVEVSDGEYEYEFKINAQDGDIVAESKELINE